MFWVIRWTDEQTDRDLAAVVEADSRDAAEAIARAANVPFIFIARASRTDIEDAQAGRLATLDSPASAPAASSYTCLGRPLAPAQLAALLLLGVATALLHLRPMLPAIVS